MALLTPVLCPVLRFESLASRGHVNQSPTPGERGEAVEGPRHWDSAWGGWTGDALVSAWCLVPGAQSPFRGASYCWKLPGAGKGLIHSHPKVEQTVMLRVLTLPCMAFLGQPALAGLESSAERPLVHRPRLGTSRCPPVPTSRACPRWTPASAPAVPGDPPQSCGDLSQPTEVDKDHTLLVPRRDEDGLQGAVTRGLQTLPPRPPGIIHPAPLSHSLQPRHTPHSLYPVSQVR